MNAKSQESHRERLCQKFIKPGFKGFHDHEIIRVCPNRVGSGATVAHDHRMKFGSRGGLPPAEPASCLRPHPSVKRVCPTFYFGGALFQTVDLVIAQIMLLNVLVNKYCIIV